MQPSQLVLRDVHLPPSPSWWPPAAGWWWLAGLLLIGVIGGLAWFAWRRRRQRRWLAWFDRQSAGEASAAQVAAMSELLRRAARRADGASARLQGEAWLRFLDGKQGNDFSQGAGRLLLEGGYRREVDVGELERLRVLARSRFLHLMAGRR